MNSFSMIRSKIRTNHNVNARLMSQKLVSVKRSLQDVSYFHCYIGYKMLKARYIHASRIGNRDRKELQLIEASKFSEDVLYM